MTKDFAEALAAVQSEIDSVSKNKTNPHFRSRYADLAAYIDEIKEPLAKHGFSVIQSVNSSVLETTLLHKSGDSIVTHIPLFLQKNDMQGLGSAITYSRRFALASLFNMGAEDDDGNGSIKSQGVSNETNRNAAPKTTGSQPKSTANGPEPRKEAPAGSSTSNADAKPFAPRNEAPISIAQAGNIYKLLELRQKSTDGFNKYINKEYGVDTATKLKAWQYDEVMEMLNK
jgi:hypothetical protein